MTGIIYKYTSPSGKSYIGQTIHPHRRHLQHINCSKDQSTLPFHLALKKYGAENMKYEVLATVDIDDEVEFHKRLDFLERFYIRKFDTYRNGYNLTEGGGGTSGLVMSEETRNLLSSQRKGVKKSEEHRKHMSEAQKGVSKNPKSVELQRQTMLDKYKNGYVNPRTGHTASDETKKKISEALTGKVAGTGNPMFGKKHSDEAKERMGAAKRGKHRVYDNSEHTKWHYER